MGDYGEVAVEVTKRISGKERFDIYRMWERIVRENFETESHIRNTSPRGVYLALCESGLIVGIEAGKYSKKCLKQSKDYALTAVELLKRDAIYRGMTPGELWREVEKTGKNHNHQMDVVIALWRAGMIV
ncbi:hypothetical protein PM10SUCC1_31420 [Propionigenium maris DSM 9537]|uniref:Uncharacterized protein n=1 Tax=Propionigenium maris DSM 9537 TaxID=1123000 RepID=A0A9W6GN76_9FUSO|nr:hypothetical protein [Propionigenium maris]GLI57628.1 hypothetical protein PM10SUCC1_31420 [Propionigenium maris DSM 9537]